MFSSLGWGREWAIHSLDCPFHGPQALSSVVFRGCQAQAIRILLTDYERALCPCVLVIKYQLTFTVKTGQGRLYRYSENIEFFSGSNSTNKAMACLLFQVDEKCNFIWFCCLQAKFEDNYVEGEVQWMREIWSPLFGISLTMQPFLPHWLIEHKTEGHGWQEVSSWGVKDLQRLSKWMQGGSKQDMGIRQNA